MKIRLLQIAVFLLIFSSCKNDQKPGIEEKNELPEITRLTNPDNLQQNLDQSGLPLEARDSLLAFYQQNNFQPVWNERKLREDLYRAIENSQFQGLFREDYHFDLLQENLSNLDELSETERAQLEILLTDTFLSYAQDLGSGKLDPNDLYEIWGTPGNQIPSIQLLKKAVSNENISEMLQEIAPQNPVYQGLQKELAEILKDSTSFSEESLPKISNGKLIHPKESDDRIPLVYERLQELGYFPDSTDSITTIYDSNLQEPLKKFQDDHGLENDGILGNSTIRELNMSKKDRYHQILVNMERWRWFPKDFGENFILINIANYHLDVVEDGDTLRSHKTMVGTLVRKTPVFSDWVRYVVFNPTWTIPPTIKKHDVIPGAAKSLDYLYSRNLKVYNSSGNAVDPTTINWKNGEANHYVFRQNPGPGNPLGRVKIIYPNQYMIYLHDTPSQSLFQKNSRARSSGCVRVEDALALAEFLLNDQKQYDHEKIEEILESGKTTEVPVTRNFKVHHLYWTAYPVGDTVRFINDVYNYDQDLWERLKPRNSEK